MAKDENNGASRFQNLRSRWKILISANVFINIFLFKDSEEFAGDIAIHLKGRPSRWSQFITFITFIIRQHSKR